MMGLVKAWLGVLMFSALIWFLIMIIGATQIIEQSLITLIALAWGVFMIFLMILPLLILAFQSAFQSMPDSDKT